MGTKNFNIDSANPVTDPMSEADFKAVITHLQFADPSILFQGANTDRQKLVNSETITGDATLNLDTLVSLLDQTTGGPYSLTIPDGNYIGEKKIILAKNLNSATFELSGTILAWNTIEFRGIARAAIMFWDGAGWHFIAGDAEPLQTDSGGTTN